MKNQIRRRFYLYKNVKSIKIIPLWVSRWHKIPIKHKVCSCKLKISRAGHIIARHCKFFFYCPPLFCGTLEGTAEALRGITPGLVNYMQYIIVTKKVLPVHGKSLWWRRTHWLITSNPLGKTSFSSENFCL